MVSTVYWTNKYKQQLPVHYVPDTETADGGLNSQNVKEAVEYASGAYKYKALPKDSLVIMHKDKGAVVGELHKPDIQVNYRADIKTSEKDSILNIVNEMGPKFPIYG